MIHRKKNIHEICVDLVFLVFGERCRDAVGVYEFEVGRYVIWEAK